MKKFLSALLSVAMVSSAFVTSAFAAAGNVSFEADKTEIATDEVISITVKSAEKTVSTDGFGVDFDTAKFELVDVVDNYGKSLAAGEAQRFRLSYEDEYGDTNNQNFSVKPDLNNSNNTGTVSWGFANTVDVTYKAATIGVIKFAPKAGTTAGTFTLWENSTAFNGIIDTIDVTVKAAPPAEVKVTGITADPAALTDLEIGATGTIAVAVAPADATEKGVTFESGDTNVITVDDAGNYEAVGAGSTEITITAKDGSGVTATVAVTVKAAPVPADKVEFIKAVKSDKAATGYWVFQVNEGISETLKVTYATEGEELTLDAPSAIGGDADVTFAVYLTVTGERVGKAFTAMVAHGTDYATGDAITLD